MLSQNPRHFLSLALIVLTPNPNPSLRLLPQLFSYQSWLSVSGNPLIKWPSLSPSPSPPPSSLPNPNSDPKFSQDDLSTIANLLADPTVASLGSELDRVGIYPSPSLVQAVFDRFDSSPKLLHTLFVWAEDLPGFQCSVISSVPLSMCWLKLGSSSLCLILDRIGEMRSVVVGLR